MTAATPGVRRRCKEHRAHIPGPGGRLRGRPPDRALRPCWRGRPIPTERNSHWNRCGTPSATPTTRRFHGSFVSPRPDEGPRLVPLRHLLYRPLIAVGITEVHKPSPGQVLDIAHRDPTARKLLVRLFDIRHHHLQTLDRTRLHLCESGADVDRTCRARRRQLHEAQILIY